MIGSSEVEGFKRQEGSTDRRACGSEVEDRHPGAGTTVQPQGKELTNGRKEGISRQQWKQSRGSGLHCLGKNVSCDKIIEPQ